MDFEQLTRRPMTFEGIAYDDDYLVIWRGLPVGRILKQSGVAYGQPNWFWGINFDQKPQPPDRRDIGNDLADCERQFKAASQRVRAGITEADVETARRHEIEADRRATRR